MMNFSHLRNHQIMTAQNRLLLRFLHDRAFAETSSRMPLHARIGEWLPRGRGIKVLELGCGPGKYVAMLTSLGYQVTGVDPIPFPSWVSIREKTDAELIDGVAAESLPFPNDSFDHAVCLGALLYFTDPVRALEELRRVVRPGGRVVVRTVNRFNLFTLSTGRRLDPASRQLFGREELEQLLDSNGFRVEESFCYGFWPPIASGFWWYLASVWLPQWLQNALSYCISPTHRVNLVCLVTSTKAVLGERAA